jgi:4-amino-4-deoxy-L-arabinose transferase-like glycosyltransferase
VTTVNATIAGLGIILAWAFLVLFFNKEAGVIAVWLMALYPESVLLGASQMREPFLIMALAGALSAYALWIKGQGKRSTFLATAILMIALLISPPFIFIVLLTIGLAWLWERRMGIRQIVPITVLGAAVAFGSVYLAARSWGALEGISGSIWQILLGWWENTGGAWRVNIVTDQSLNLDVLLNRMPAWSQVPFLVVFGLAQPFLPAALASPGALIWRVIGILRSLGWFFFLPFFAYAPIFAVRNRREVRLGTLLAFYIWITALMASYRAPSYQWDNPRYRVVYLVVQAALIGWIWVKSREEKDPWIARLGWALGGFSLVIAHWYLGRSFDTPSLSLPVTMLSALGVAVIIPVLGLVRDYRSRRKIPSRSLEV